jgi:periplasmic protein TonB
MTSERAQDWVDGIVLRLIRRAARRAPDMLADRLEEEWLADLAERRGQWARLRFGIGCCWATNVIAREHVVAAALPAAVSPAMPGVMRFPSGDSPFFTGRTMTLVLVATLHLAVLYGLAMGLSQHYPKRIAVPFEAREIPPLPRSHPPLPLPPGPQIMRPDLDLPTPKPMPPIQLDRPDIVQVPTSDPPPVSGAPQTPRSVVNRIEGGPGIGFPSTTDFYPDAAIRAGEAGAVTVNACVNGNGRLISEPTIIQSTGSMRLDQAALKLAKAGSGHYRATTEDGQPVNSCYAFRIRFQLRN